MVDQRKTIESLCAERNVDFSTLSRLVGRNPAYIQQYIRRGTPRELAEKDRRLIADFFGVADEALGGPAPRLAGNGLVSIARREVRASAGAGAHNDAERSEPYMAFDDTFLRDLTASKADKLAMIKVAGDSMHPTLASGDDILVDHGDAAERLRDGVYVLRIDDALVVKRLALHPLGRTVTIQSDNPAYADWPGLAMDEIEVVGRVLWAGRKLG